MRRSDLKTYFSRYNRLPRLFVARNLGFIYMRGGIGYEFWFKWAKIVKPCTLLDRKIIVGRGLPRGKVNNSYGRRLYQRHVSDYYVEREFYRFGLDPQRLPLVSWSFDEHKNHCLGVELGYRPPIPFYDDEGHLLFV